MKILDMTKMQEATRLTRAGRLDEALALLQGARAGETNHQDASDKVIEGEIISKVEWPSKRFTNTPYVRPFDGVNVLGRGRRALNDSDLAPSGGRNIGGSFSNPEGTRHYKLYIPSAQNAGARPLIVMLHGCTQTADDFAAGTRMNFVAEEHGCFVVYPEQPQGANVSKCWNWFRPGDQMREKGEPSLIAGITRQVVQTHNIDPSRVYVAGLSAGGAAAAIMGETYPDLYAAVGVHSGLACGVAHDMPSAFSAMSGSKNGGSSTRSGNSSFKPTIVFHGDNDSTVHPCNGAHVIDRASGDTKIEMRTEQRSATNGHSFSRSVHRDESGMTVLELWELHGAGHYWSGGNPAGSFASEDGPDASAEMLRFFLQHRLHEHKVGD
jgi:poly(hydroxyalkanoate) depolymerase family esterase